MNNEIYYWASDTSGNSGEGILAKKFLKKLKELNNSLKFININKFDNNKNTITSKYFLPFFSVMF